MHFSKAHAYGNDFLYVEADQVRGVPLGALARDLCDRHTGIGADGLIIYEPTRGGATMTLTNADGSPAEVSGNGVRGLGALLLVRGDRAGTGALTIQTDAGPKTLTPMGHSNGRPIFRAAMGQPVNVREVPVTAGGESFALAVMTFGNPQCVRLGPLPDEERFRRIGSALERHPLFPEGSNVEFAHVEAPGTVRILIWERGVGPTRSSGTGSCAALIAAATFGGAAREADVVAPGGTQHVEWRNDGVYLTGWAEVICDGEWRRPLPHR
jgi:diaminopimelate epimerase